MFSLSFDNRLKKCQEEIRDAERERTKQLGSENLHRDDTIDEEEDGELGEDDPSSSAKSGKGGKGGKG